LSRASPPENLRAMAAADAESLARYLAVAEAAARGAGAMIRTAHEQRGLGLAIESKGSAATQTVDLVTATDKACEEYIIGTIKATFPDHAFIGEESSFTGPGAAAVSAPLELTQAPTWIIDPLDGTTNFVHGYPLVTVSIGLAVGKELVLGVVYNPLMDELCSAVRPATPRENINRASRNPWASEQISLDAAD